MPALKPIPQQEALELATQCAALLRARFGAKRVIPFGSVVGAGTWHAGSDLDLAVEGVAPEQFFRAWSALRALLPPGLDIDLVDLEQAGEALRARILGEHPLSEAPWTNLQALINDELAALDRIVLEMQAGVDSLEEPPSSFDLNALASYLHQFYTGCERILERIATTVDGTVPGGGVFPCQSPVTNDSRASRHPPIRPA